MNRMLIPSMIDCFAFNRVLTFDG